METQKIIVRTFISLNLLELFYDKFTKKIKSIVAHLNELNHPAIYI